MKVVYGVRWIEVEFGERDEGWALFLDKEKCFASTREASRKGSYEGGGGYLGPERPLTAYEIPFASLDAKLRAKLQKNGTAHTENRWEPKFRGVSHSITGG